MTAVFRDSSGTFSGINATSITVAVPAGVVEGDLMIAFINMGPSPLITAPAGWEHVAGSPHFQDETTDNHFSIMTRTADAGDESGGVYQWTRASQFTPIGGVIAAFQDADIVFLNIDGERDSHPAMTSPLYSGVDVNSDLYLTALAISGEWFLGGNSIISPSDMFTEIEDVNFDGNGGHTQVQYRTAISPGAQSIDVNLTASIATSTHSWVMMGLGTAFPRGIINVSPPNAPEGVDLDQPVSFSVVGPANIESLGLSVRYLRDPNTYVIYETDDFTAKYAPESSVAGLGTTKVDFTAFEFGGWRGDILDMTIFGIDADGVKFLFSVLEGSS